MPDPISWYALGRDVNDPTTIDEDIDAKILAHNFDPSAHGQSDEAVYNHRISTLLDHVNYSIYNIKLHPETRPIKAFVDVGGAAEFTDLQGAIDYVHALGGGRIFVKEGTYLLTANVTLYSDIQIQGDDRDTVLFDFQGGALGFRAEGTSGVHLHNIKIEDIQVTGCANINNPTILFDYVDDADIVNNKFIDNYDSNENAYIPISIQHSTQVNVKSNYFNTSSGVYVVSNSANIIVEDNYFYNFGTSGVYCESANHVVFRHNYFDGTEEDATYFAGSNIIVDGNYFVNCSATVIVLEASDIIVVNNIIIGNADTPLAIWKNGSLNRCIIANNRMVGAMSEGIYLASGVGLVIANNICEGATIGLDLQAGLNYSSITGNVFKGCGTPISNAGTGNVLSGNVV